MHLHMLLAQMKKYCEENGLGGTFSKYDELDISPFQVHRSKEEHKQAILVLGTELASLTAMDDLTRKKKKQQKKVHES